MTSTLSGGPTTVSSLATDSNGCAVYGGLDGGSYTVNFSDPGYVDVNGNAPPASQTLTVVPTETAQTTRLDLAQPGTLSATFSTKYTNGGSTVSEAATDDQFVAINNGADPGGLPHVRDRQHLDEQLRVQSISSGATMFPFPGPGYTRLRRRLQRSPARPRQRRRRRHRHLGNTTSVVLPEPAMIILPEVAAGSPTTLDDRPSSNNGVVGQLLRHLDTTPPCRATTTAPRATAARPAAARPSRCRRSAAARRAVAARRASRVSRRRHPATATPASRIDGGAGASPVDLYNSSTSRQQIRCTPPSALDPSVSHTIGDDHRSAATRTPPAAATRSAIDAFKYTGIRADDDEAEHHGHRHRQHLRQQQGLSARAGSERDDRRIGQPGAPVRQLHRLRRQRHQPRRRSAGVTNTSYTGSNYVYAFIDSASPQYGTGKCT